MRRTNKQIVEELYKLGYQYKDNSKGSATLHWSKDQKHMCYILKKTNHTNQSIPLRGKVIVNGCLPDDKKSVWKFGIISNVVLENLDLLKEIDATI